MSERPILELANVIVTTTKVVINGTTYFLPNITSVKVVEDNNLRIGGAILIALAGIGAALGIATWAPVGILMGILGLVAGGLMVRYGVSWELVLTTGATEQHTVSSRDKSVITRVAAAINVAAENRTSR